MKNEACANLQITDNVIVVRVWYLLPFTQFYNDTTNNTYLFILSISVIFQKDWVCRGEEEGSTDLQTSFVCNGRAFHESFHVLYAVKNLKSLLSDLYTIMSNGSSTLLYISVYLIVVEYYWDAWLLYHLYVHLWLTPIIVCVHMVSSPLYLPTNLTHKVKFKTSW